MNHIHINLLRTKNYNFYGLAAIILVQGISTTGQLTGIAITMSIAIFSGLLSGKIIGLFGSKKLSYFDAEEFMEEWQVTGDARSLSLSKRPVPEVTGDTL